jgi:hypothetical protein
MKALMQLLRRLTRRPSQLFPHDSNEASEQLVESQFIVEVTSSGLLEGEKYKG